MRDCDHMFDYKVTYPPTGHLNESFSVDVNIRRLKEGDMTD